MSRAEEIFKELNGEVSPSSTDGEPRIRWQLRVGDLKKALDRMPEGASLWSMDNLTDERNAKQAMRDALWVVAEPLVRKIAQAPDGSLIETK